MATYLAKGKLIDYTPSSAVAAGDVVLLSSLVTVAPRPIAANKLGAVAVEGAWILPKATGAIGQGKVVYWNQVDGKITTSADDGGSPAVAYFRAGKAAEAAASGDATVKVLLNIG